MYILKATDQRLELLVAIVTLYRAATSLVTWAATLHCSHVVCHAFPVSALSWEVFVGVFKERNGGSCLIFLALLPPLLVSTRLGREGSAERKE